MPDDSFYKVEFIRFASGKIIFPGAMRVVNRSIDRLHGIADFLSCNLFHLIFRKITSMKIEINFYLTTSLEHILTKKMDKKLPFE